MYEEYVNLTMKEQVINLDDDSPKMATIYSRITPSIAF